MRIDYCYDREAKNHITLKQIFNLYLSKIIWSRTKYEKSASILRYMYQTGNNLYLPH